MMIIKSSHIRRNLVITS